MTRILDKKYETIQDYARNYDSLTDEQADAYIKGRAAVEESVRQLRLKYMPMFRKVLSGENGGALHSVGLAAGPGHGPSIGLASPRY